jgi:phosphate transport system protein
LALVLHDSRMIRRALDIMQMMKALERCGEHCRNVAEHAIFMLDGIDVRHGEQSKLQ